MTKSTVFQIRCTDAEKARWTAIAEARGLTLTELVRQRLDEDVAPAQADHDYSCRPCAEDALASLPPKVKDACTYAARAIQEQATKPRLCPRCQRVGKVKDCPQCKELET